MKSEIFFRDFAPRRRIEEFFVKMVMNVDFFRQKFLDRFSRFRTHVVATTVCTYTHLLHAHFSARNTCTFCLRTLRTLLMRVTHTHGSSSKRVRKVFVAHASYLPILPSLSHVSPVSAVPVYPLRHHLSVHNLAVLSRPT